VETEKTHYIFSRPNGERLFVNYGDKAGILATSALAAVQIFFYPAAGIPTIRWLYALLFMFVMSAIMKITFRRFAHRIGVDREDGVIVFDLLRGAGNVKAEIHALKAIEIGFHISFVIGRRRLFYNGVTDKELIALLGTLKPIEWRRRGRWIYRHW
jgi:hypothetical protein